ncbi:hypothetical protein GN956_G16903 [Arapaima gigas]
MRTEVAGQRRSLIGRRDSAPRPLRWNSEGFVCERAAMLSDGAARRAPDTADLWGGESRGGCAGVLGSRPALAHSSSGNYGGERRTG